MSDEDKVMSDLDLLEIQDKEAVKNTYYRSPKVTPHITKYADHLEIKTIDNKTDIYKIDETVLYIIADFKFTPVWLIKQWYEDFNLDGYAAVESWISVGIVWAETSSLGVFIRPTKILFDMMDIRNVNYISIPFGLLNHTCAEAQIVFDMTMGNRNSELWQLIKKEETLPCYRPLKLNDSNTDGTIVIREDQFSVNHFKPNQIVEKQDALIRDIDSNKKFTLEFNDFSYFVLTNFTDDNVLITQKPDLAIPIPRINGKPQSCSIELELSAKTPDKYIQIMKNYKNNLIYGKLFYLCATTRISKLVTEAYKAVEGLGTCRLFIVPFVPPAQKLSTYKLEDETIQKTMLKLTIKNSKKE